MNWSRPTREEEIQIEGRHYTFLTKLGPYTTTAGIGIVGLVHDITVRRNAELRSAFLTEATELLSSSLDWETTLHHVARLAIPRLADLAFVDLFESSGQTRGLAVAHADPAKEVKLRELRRLFPPAPGTSTAREGSRHNPLQSPRTMESDAKRRFDSVSIREEWGVADATGFHLYEAHRYALSGFPFSVCRIDGRQVAIFIDMDVPVDARADLTSRKPDWLDAVVYARLISEPRAEIAVIDADVPNHDDLELGACAFATACVAFNYGLFKIVPSSYLVRFGTRVTVRAILELDDDAQSWFGESAVDTGGA